MNVRRGGIRWVGVVLGGGALIVGCATEPPSGPDPGPGGGSVSRNGLAGLVQAPAAMHRDGGAWESIGPLNETPLVGVEVTLLGSKGEPLEVPPAKTNAEGVFRFDAVPVEAGLVRIMPPAVEATKPLLAYYHRGRASYVGVSSTIVAGALQKALRDQTALTYASFDPDAVEALQAQVEAKFASGTKVGLHFLDQVLIPWARQDTALKQPLEALSPGITTIPSPTPVPGLKQKR